MPLIRVDSDSSAEATTGRLHLKVSALSHSEGRNSASSTWHYYLGRTAVFRVAPFRYIKERIVQHFHQLHSKDILYISGPSSSSSTLNLFPIFFNPDPQLLKPAPRSAAMVYNTTHIRPDVPPPQQSVEGMVKETVLSLLGRGSVRQPMKAPANYSPRGLPIYDTLTRLLHFSPHAEFWWRKLGAPFASMLNTAQYPLLSQCKFLCFFYKSIIVLMAPHDAPHSDSVMTIDGSPVELSWVLPQSRDAHGSGGGDAAPSKSHHRQVRFAIEPMHFVSGRRLKGSPVLDFLTSPEGSLGMVVNGKDSMTWRNKTEDFLFPNAEGEDIPEGSRFFIGFDFLLNGTISLKAYYLPAPYSADIDVTQQSPLNLWDVNYEPLRRLITILEPALSEPLELLLSYFESLEDRHKPRIQIIAMDCVKSSENRLKIYCRPKEGTSWSDAVRSFTLGGRLESPQMKDTLGHMERLWNSLFPQANSKVDCDLHVAAALDEEELLDLNDGNGICLNKKQHPVGGLLYYYSVFAGKHSVYPKLYLPVTHYCANDLAIARAIENFYADYEHRTKRSQPEFDDSDWVAKEVSKVFNHRPLEERTGLHTYVTFALKKKGWELTNYFSPEVYA